MERKWNRLYAGCSGKLLILQRQVDLIKRAAAFNVECLDSVSGFITELVKGGYEIHFYHSSPDFSPVSPHIINRMSEILPPDYSFSVMEVCVSNRSFSTSNLEESEQVKEYMMLSEVWIEDVFKKRVLMVFGKGKEHPFWLRIGIPLVPIG